MLIYYYCYVRMYLMKKCIFYKKGLSCIMAPHPHYNTYLLRTSLTKNQYRTRVVVRKGQSFCDATRNCLLQSMLNWLEGKRERQIDLNTPSSWCIRDGGAQTAFTGLSDWPAFSVCSDAEQDWLHNATPSKGLHTVALGHRVLLKILLS